MRVIVALALLVTCVVCDPLCTPDQWEGHATDLIGYSKNKEHGIAIETSTLHYDATNERSAVFIRIQTGAFKKHFTIVTRYEDGVGKRYTVDKQTGECAKKDLASPFQKICLAEKAKFDSSFSFGLDKEFEMSSYIFEDGGLQRNVLIHRSGDSYVPVEESMFGVLLTYQTVQTIRFSDITSGIKDESIFDVPEQCNENEEYFNRINDMSVNDFVFGA